jgi:hypothetical protein
MARVQIVATIAAGAPRVWDLVGDFGAIAKWHPGVARSSVTGGGIGMMRRLTLASGETLVERLEEFNDAERYYAYSFTEGPLPVSDCYTTLRVRAAYDAPSCTIEWSAAFTPKEDVAATDAELLIRSIYQAGIDNLRQKLTS